MPNIGKSLGNLGKTLSGSKVKNLENLSRRANAQLKRSGQIAKNKQSLETSRQLYKDLSKSKHLAEGLGNERAKMLKARGIVGAAGAGVAGLGAGTGAGYALSRSREKSAFAEDFGLEKSAGRFDKYHIQRKLNKHQVQMGDLFAARKPAAESRAAQARVDAAMARTAPNAEAAKKHIADTLRKERKSRAAAGKVIRAYDKLPAGLKSKKNLAIAGGALAGAGALTGGGVAAYKHFKNKEAALYMDAIEKVALTDEQKAEIETLKKNNSEAYKSYLKELKDNGYWGKGVKSTLLGTTGSTATGLALAGIVNRNPKLAIGAGIPAAALDAAAVRNVYSAYKDVLKPAQKRYFEAVEPNNKRIREIKHS